MKIYFRILKTIIPSLKQEDIYVPIRNTGIDSLGFLAIRVEIEKHLGFEIPDNEWIRFECFNDLINFCESKSKSKIKTKVKLNDLKAKRSYLINLPQMANYALSENWLFKELGDLHWQLLCNGLHTKSALLKDEDENRLYATFIHIQIKCSSLRSFQENSQIDFDAKIMRYGQNNYLSEIKCISDSRKIDAKLMTIFSKREGPDNLELIKCHPIVKTNSVPDVEKMPTFLTDY